ncbi:hypothetical protein PghCCS26_47840 [Paenibacillus glycanilyticus]|uniref:Phage major tail protein, TP901-1 family n=1 Tax=Paenibacillus glycanilyticus TaxID=126569 RepID=A0ABQ6NUI9_9BACL|nr:hypothetical protein [Paenibacillus glycanilyticus]GMK47654.1 hypothetical protein PghCCS26_47840 [Paenibacillus glycanilyticus]
MASTKTGQYAKITTKVGSASAVELAKLREWSVSVESEKIDATVAGDTWARNLTGVLSWSGEATCVDADPYWLDLVNATTPVTIDFFDNEDDPKPKYRGTALIDFERTTPYDDLIETKVTFTGDGALVDGSTLTP